MKSRLSFYGKYNDTKLPWAPKLPSHWQIWRNGKLFSQRIETGFPDLPILEVSLKTGVRIRDMSSNKRKQVMSDKEKYKRAVKGDIAYNMMRMWQGAVGIAPVDGLISPAYVVARPFVETNSSYYGYLFRTADYKDEINRFSRGIVSDRNRLYWDEFKQMPSIVPPRDEQNKIVTYLRAQDAHITRFIKTKRELISLLNEQKQTLVHQAVTKGIDPNVKLKPSGVEWIGEIPEGWQISKVKLLAEYINGYAFNPTEWAGSGRPIIRIQNLTKPDVPCNYFNGTIPTRYIIRTGDILLSWSASLGVFVWQREDAWLNQHIFKVVPNLTRITPGYFVWLAKWFLNHMTSEAHGSTMQHITKPKFGSFPVPLPPIETQAGIEAHLDLESRVIDDTIQRANEEIELTREYRDRLIANVVTGQIDVRNWQPGPDDEVDEPDLSVLTASDELMEEEYEHEDN